MTRVVTSRRTVIKGLGAAAAVGAVGMPTILRAADQVRIGFMAPMTGDEALLGQTQHQCYQLAIDDLNAAGGIAGREIVSIVEDDETNTKATIDKARKLIGQDNVDVIIGLLASFERQAAMSVTIPAKKLLIYPTYYEGGDCNHYLIESGRDPRVYVLDGRITIVAPCQAPAAGFYWDLIYARWNGVAPTTTWVDGDPGLIGTQGWIQADKATIESMKAAINRKLLRLLAAI